MKMRLHFIASMFLLSCTICAHAQIINTIAGNGHHGYCCDDSLAIYAELNVPTYLAFDTSGNLLFTEEGNNRIRKIDKSGVITTVVGTGIPGYNGDGILATNADINFPVGICVDKDNNIIFSDGYNYRIREVDADGVIHTICGTGIPGYNGEGLSATETNVSGVCGLAEDQQGNLYFADGGIQRIRKIQGGSSQIVTTVAGIGLAGFSGDGGPATSAQVYDPGGLAIDSHNNLFFTDISNGILRMVDTNGIINTVAGCFSYSSLDSGLDTNVCISQPFGVFIDNNDNVYLSDMNFSCIRLINKAGFSRPIAGIPHHYGFSGDGSLAVNAKIFQPLGVVVDKSGVIYFADNGNNRIRMINNVVSISEVTNESGEFSIFPNPSERDINLIYKSRIGNSGKVIISDILGSVVKKIEIKPNTQITIQPNLISGVYYASLIVGSICISNKMLVIN